MVNAAARGAAPASADPRPGRLRDALARRLARTPRTVPAPSAAGPRPAVPGPAGVGQSGIDQSGIGQSGGAAGGVRVLAASCERIAAGDLDQRIPPLGDDPELVRVRTSINHLLDVTDAFVRESQASLAAAGAGRFYRAFLLRGMPGAFRAAAALIDGARTAMATAEEHEARARDLQQRMAGTASDAAQIVAAAAVELSASADALNETTGQAVSQAHSASEVVDQLQRASEGIKESLAVISKVTSQTRMLALNATIEAARAGDAGRGFAVVAGEVKSLADETAEANARIHEQVETSHQAARDAIQAITQITALIQDVDLQVAEINRAANGGPGIEGLAQMAERLHTDTGQLAEIVPSD